MLALCTQLHDSEVKSAVRYLERLSGPPGKPAAPGSHEVLCDRPRADDFDEMVQQAVIRYHQRTTTDPFIIWFQQRLNGVPKTDISLRLRAIITDARFNQAVRAEKALQNTTAVYDLGLLHQREANSRLPLLLGTRFHSPEGWQRQYRKAMPLIWDLAQRIKERPRWTAGQLLAEIENHHIPNVGAKVARLTVRWIHLLIPEVIIDMTTALVPVDRMVYRVSARLGILKAEQHPYSGKGSPGELAIQRFATRVFPEDPTLLDEPFWMMGRGFCDPVAPRCAQGCIFIDSCPKCMPEADPWAVGFEHRPRGEASPVSVGGGPCPGLLVMVACVSEKVWDNDPEATKLTPAGVAYTSTLLRKSRDYAQRYGEAWLVFSAKYGFMRPHELIENYNETFKNGGPNLVTVERLREQVSEKALHLFSRIIVLGGRAYVDRVRLAFGGQNVQILDPMEGKPIGKRLHWLKNPESPCGPEPPH